MSYKIAILLFLFSSSIPSFVFASNQEAKLTLEEEIDPILMRKIGHEILLYLGDSTSTLLPIKEIVKNTYQIEFDIPFKFHSDSIIKIINTNIEQNKPGARFLVNVIDCQDNQIIFGYAMLKSKSDDLMSCLGRDQVENCYKINIKFEDSRAKYIQKQYLNAGTSLFVVFLLSFALYKLYKSNNKIEENTTESNDDWKFNLGRFVFNSNEQSLIFREDIIELTSKESKLLFIFASNPNQVIDRDTLQKEVWENEGIIVGRSLDMFISKLRKKLDPDPSVKIINIHGKGYKLMVKE